MPSTSGSLGGRLTTTANGAELLYWPAAYSENIRKHKLLPLIQQAIGVAAIPGTGEIFAEVWQ